MSQGFRQKEPVEHLLSLLAQLGRADEDQTVLPCIPVSLAFRPISAIPPHSTSLLVMVQYSAGQPAFCKRVEYRDGEFFDYKGSRLLGDVICWTVAPAFEPDTVDQLRKILP